MEVNKIVHEENWEFYFSNVNDTLSSFFIDLGFYKIAPIKDKPNLVWVYIKMNNPRKDGLSSNEEFEKLAKIEDNIVDEFSKKYSAIFVGRVTTDGDRQFYFYCNDTAYIDKTLSEIMKVFPDYQYQQGVEDNRDWNYYLDFLYPLPQQIQRIQNRKIVDALKDNGDKLVKERFVNHWIYFKTEKNRTDFLSKIKNDSFIIVSENFDNELGELPYSLQIKRLDKVDLDSVDEYVVYLFTKANECNGDYDGWETSIEK
jgi:uncharacterized protein (TIGR01619 family)